MRVPIAIALTLSCSSEPASKRPPTAEPAAVAGSASQMQGPMIDFEKLKTSPKLSLIIDTRLAMPIAYGNRWNAKVKQVVAGDLADTEISLSTFGGLDGHFNSDETQLPVTFVKLDQRPAAFAGFVAADGTTWMIWSVGK